MKPNMSYLLNYIRFNDNWKDTLVEKPYCLKIKQHQTYPDLFLFSYNMIESDFYNPIVRAARGSVIDVKNNKVVCHAFDKFGNYGEPYALKVQDESGEIVDTTFDWNSASFLEKVDGSLIKLFYNPYSFKWEWMTNNSFDTNFLLNHGIPGGDQYDSFQKLINAANHNIYEQLTKPEYKDLTFMFELVSPYNRVVVKYDDINLYFLGVRSNITHFEMSSKTFVENCGITNALVPKEFAVGRMSLDEAIDIVSKFDCNQEGLVVVDKNFNRLKIKGQEYLQVHKMKSNDGQISKKLIFESIQNGTSDDIRSHFPEYETYFAEMISNYQRLSERTMKSISESIIKFNELSKSNDVKEARKKYAKWIFDDSFRSEISKVLFDIPKVVSVSPSEATESFMRSIDYEYFEKMKI